MNKTGIESPTAYPLCWPVGWPRKHSYERISGNFKGTPAAVLNQMQRAVDGLVYGKQSRFYTAQYDLIVSCNARLRKDGAPWAQDMDTYLPDPGVAIYFRRKEKPFCLACDNYDRIWKNMRALQLTLEALAGIERWGSSQLLDRAFEGFAALPAPGESAAETWYQVLEISPDADEAAINAAWRTKVKLAHPDAGGGNEEIYRINEARDKAILQLQKS